MKLMIVLIMPVFIMCGSNKKQPTPIVTARSSISILEQAQDTNYGVFQTVVYNRGRYCLDTWAYTEKDQSHSHWVLDNGEGSWSFGGSVNFPFDSCACGSFQYIKELKPKQYAKAKSVFDYEIKMGKEKRRKEDSAKSSFAIRQDSVKMLIDLKVQ